jgi:hypothetical protein
MGASIHLDPLPDAGQFPPLRLAGVRDASPRAETIASITASITAAITAEELLRDARRAILDLYGPCCAASLTLVRAWATRLAETRPMPLANRRALLAELQDLFA